MKKHVCIYGKPCWCGATDDTPLAIGVSPGAWPMVSDALAVHPKQSAQANERAKRHGLTGVYYDRKGLCHISDRKSRKRLLALEGYFDRVGGYGD